MGVELQTERLLLRPMIEEDVHNLFELNTDTEVVQYTGNASFENLQEAMSVIRDITFPQWEKYQMGRFSTFLKDGTYIGWCGLKYLEEKDEVDLGYRFMKKFWGKGYATEASRVCLDYGFNQLWCEVITAHAMTQNVASIEVMKKLGMSFTHQGYDGEVGNELVHYEITKHNYLRVSKKI